MENWWKTLSSTIVIAFAMRDSANGATIIRCTYGRWYGWARTSSTRVACLCFEEPRLKFLRTQRSRNLTAPLTAPISKNRPDKIVVTMITLIRFTCRPKNQLISQRSAIETIVNILSTPRWWMIHQLVILRNEHKQF